MIEIKGILEIDVSRGALSAWQGAEDDPPHRMYQIIPILEDERSNDAEVSV